LEERDKLAGTGPAEWIQKDPFLLEQFKRETKPTIEMILRNNIKKERDFYDEGILVKAFEEMDANQNSVDYKPRGRSRRRLTQTATWVEMWRKASKEQRDKIREALRRRLYPRKEQVKKDTTDYKKLLEAQMITEKKLGTLIDTVDRIIRYRSGKE
jgi:hypothetical protein